jgi:hypothetical protein
MGLQTSPIENKTRIAGVLSNRQSYSNYGKRKRKAAIAPSIAKPSGNTCHTPTRHSTLVNE